MLCFRARLSGLRESFGWGHRLHLDRPGHGRQVFSKACAQPARDAVQQCGSAAGGVLSTTSVEVSEAAAALLFPVVVVGYKTVAYRAVKLMSDRVG